MNDETLPVTERFARACALVKAIEKYTFERRYRGLFSYGTAVDNLVDAAAATEMFGPLAAHERSLLSLLEKAQANASEDVRDALETGIAAQRSALAEAIYSELSPVVPAPPAWSDHPSALDSEPANDESPAWGLSASTFSPADAEGTT